MDEETVRVLTAARLSGERIARYPGDRPNDKAAAFAIQCAVKARLGWRQRGWKIGCTSERAQRALGTDGPFPGPIYAERLYESGARVPTHPTNARTTEPEIAFTMARALPDRGSAYNVDEVLAAVASVHPAIEIVNPRLPNGFADPVEWYIADGALNHALVLGVAVGPLPRQAYAAIATRIFVNDEHRYNGLGANALGGPELALTWLANDLIAKGTRLEAGDIVSTGVITDIFDCALGDHIKAEFDALGSVEARF